MPASLFTTITSSSSYIIFIGMSSGVSAQSYFGYSMRIEIESSGFILYDAFTGLPFTKTLPSSTAFWMRLREQFSSLIDRNLSIRIDDCPLSTVTAKCSYSPFSSGCWSVRNRRGCPAASSSRSPSESKSSSSSISGIFSSFGIIGKIRHRS